MTKSQDKKLLEGKPLKDHLPNIASLLEKNVQRFPSQDVIRERKNGEYQGTSWSAFYSDIKKIAYSLQQLGFEKGDKMVIFSPNRLEMLETELAVMASGGVAVPIFAFYPQNIAGHLISYCDAKFLAIAGERQLNNISTEIPVDHILIFDEIKDQRFPNLMSFSSFLQDEPSPDFSLDTGANPEDICLNMYTSGTTGDPKCVQLTHQNILSQQAALDELWDLNEHDRFLSYLPWHHSFGGIFELFNALYRGATLSLESGYGKDPGTIMENWEKVRPTVFFSVPKVYKELVELTYRDAKAEQTLFHSGLKFIFTAAAPLPEELASEFQKRGISIIEGWGLTETSPCCSLTEPGEDREPGVVGKPIPGVSVRISGKGEIQVKGPNVMTGYYKNEQANKQAFTEDHWFRTGDLGKITEKGLKILGRMDRVFKLSNGEKVHATELENTLQQFCHYISFTVVEGAGQSFPVALLFPNKNLLDHPNYLRTPMDDCFCPRSLQELSKCLRGCMNDANSEIQTKFSKVKYALLVDDELSIENGTLTPSMKVSAKKVVNKYKDSLQKIFREKKPREDEVYLIPINREE